jgi:DNA polymerase-1
MKNLTAKAIIEKYSQPYTQKDSDLSFYSWDETQVLLKSNYLRSPENSQLKHFEAPLQLITTGKQLERAISAISNSRIIGIDCETTGLDPYRAKVRLIQIAVLSKPVLVIDLAALAENELEPLRHLLASSCLKIGHNLKFELMMLRMAGFILKPPFFDTYLSYKVITAGLKKTSTLEILAARLLHLKLDKKQQKSNFSARLTQSQLQYAANDAAVLLPLYRVLKHKLKKANLLSTARDEFNCLPSVAIMELNGIKLDLEKWLGLGDRLREKQEQLKHSIDRQLNSSNSNQCQQLFLAEELNRTINLRSPTQVVQALNNIGIQVKSTSASELVFLAPKYPIVEQLLEYRSIATRISTFSEGLPNFLHPVTGRIHGNWWQLGARSGRFSCSKPNLTNIPRDFETRSCFVANSGNVLIKADYSQIELRLIAKVSGDRRMCRAYQQGRDLHRLTAAHIFNTNINAVDDEQRRLGKIVNFGLIYGMGVKKFCLTTAIDYGIYLESSQAKLFRERFFQLYSGIADYHSRVRNQWQRGIRVSRTLDGRRRLWSKQNPPTLNEMLNYPIQGTNATIIKRAIAKVDRKCDRERLNIRLIAVVHDEILLECPKHQATRVALLLEHCMVNAARPLLFPIPVIVDCQITDSWN